MSALSARILSGFTALLRTLSGRIILGFTVLTLTFAGVTTNIVVNQRRLESWVELVNDGYLPLAQRSKDLARRCEDLKTYLSEGFDKESTADTARIKLDGLRQRRTKELGNTKEFFTDLAIEFDQKHLLRDAVDRIQLLVDAQKPHYDHVELALQHGETLTSTAVNESLAPLRDGERQIASQSNELARQVSASVEYYLKRLKSAEQEARRITIVLGAIAVLLGLLVTAWVVATLRPLRRLREATRRVAAGEYGNRIEEKGPAEVVELAREFNSMGRAVEERERELVRSERLAAVGKMAAMITHEVRNPLSSIGLNTELLEEELGRMPDAASEEGRALCRAITREVDRLTAITEEYLAFARLPTPRLAAEQLDTVVGNLATFVREDLAARGVTLVSELAGDLPRAMIDEGQIRQALLNLVRNAAEAGGAHVWLRTRRAGDERIEVEVADDGPGIPAGDLPRLFDPFFSTKEGGTGLGLALTQQIVHDHGGDIRVASNGSGKGATFVVSVPVASETRVEVAKAAPVGS